MGILLRQVAERAGVSGATVSRVLNDVDVRIAPDTRRRIKCIASEMGYQPNRTARALATGRTQTIALWSSNLRSAYYAELINHTREEILAQNYELMISSAQVGENGAFDAAKLSSWPVDGVLTFDLPRGIVPMLENSLLAGKPFVAAGGYVPDSTDYVRVDFADQAFAAIVHLRDVGCKRIAYLVPDWFEWFRKIDDERLRGYETAMAQMGKTPEYIITPAETRRSIGPVLKQYIGRHGVPDGLFCFNDDMAIGAYRALRELGLRIPNDVALIGCDGIEDTEYFDPPLTTIVQPVVEMCSTAWEFLCRRIAEPTLPLQQLTLRARLEIRGSSLRQ